MSSEDVKSGLDEEKETEEDEKGIGIKKTMNAEEDIDKVLTDKDDDAVIIEDEEGIEKKKWKKEIKKKTRDEEIRDAERERLISGWEPKTSLGMKVRSGEIKNIEELMGFSSPIKEVEIVDILLPNLDEEIIDVARVQRTTDSGRRMRFRVTSAVGNRNGYVGVGKAKGKEAGPTIRKAIEKAKLNIKRVKRGCGSWECGCRELHSVPFKVIGKCGSVRVFLSPAPKGTGLVSGEIAKKVLALAGIKDVWVHTEGYTRTNINFSFAVLDALENTNRMKISEKDIETLGIVSGAV
jgi:small subunit ribosomal protein S5